jgi:hypothetical protein
MSKDSEQLPKSAGENGIGAARAKVQGALQLGHLGNLNQVTKALSKVIRAMADGALTAKLARASATGSASCGRVLRPRRWSGSRLGLMSWKEHPRAMATGNKIGRLSERIEALAYRRRGRLTLESVTDEGWAKIEQCATELKQLTAGARFCANFRYASACFRNCSLSAPSSVASAIRSNSMTCRGHVAGRCATMCLQRVAQ